ncbi:amino acid permease [Brevundimonas sp.]|uniref:amino acid permease n=1 Tax=Brevundimonas sp. TaxID=1871086 RepID=UPI002FCA3549
MSQIDIISTDNRRLGWGVAALVVAGNMIGSGVYLLPVTLAPTGSSSLIGWIVCGIGAITLALVFGGLGRLMPTADGLSDFAAQGLGRFLGYQAGLFYWGACLVGNVAVAVAAIGYLAFFIPVLKEPLWGALANLAVVDDDRRLCAGHTLGGAVRGDQSGGGSGAHYSGDCGWRHRV